MTPCYCGGCKACLHDQGQFCHDEWCTRCRNLEVEEAQRRQDAEQQHQESQIWPWLDMEVE